MNPAFAGGARPGGANPVLVNVRGGLGTLALSLLAVCTPVAHASAACNPNDASFRYTTSRSSATFVVRPSCFGSRDAVGDLTVHYTGRRCDALGCVAMREQTVVCRWSTKGCTKTLTIEHGALERAEYSFGQDFTNSSLRRVAAAGADTVAASCTSLGVTFVCA